MPEINPAFVDVETGDSGQAMGCQKRTDNLGDAHPLFGNAVAVIPRNEWVEQQDDTGLVSMVAKIKNQRQESSCAGFAAVQAFETVWNLAYGKENWVEVSGTSIYKACGRNANSGSTISCISKRIKEVGALPVPSDRNRDFIAANGINPNHVMEAVGFSQPWPQDYQQTANLFRISEMYEIDSFDELATAMLKGFSVLYGRKGHAICGCNLRRYKGQWAIKYANSWGNWGEAGFGYDTESYVSREVRAYGAVAFRAPRGFEFKLRGSQ